MSKTLNKTLSIILAILMIVSVMPMAFAADDTVTIDLADGNIKITETGYSINHGAETPFTGDYIITGKNDESKREDVIRIESLAEGSDITLKDVEIAQNGPQCINVKTDVALKATGTLKLSNTSPTILVQAENFAITGDADISVNTGNNFINSYSSSSKLEINCNSLELTATSAAPVIYVYSTCKINVVNDAVINGLFSSGNLEIKAGGDIFVGNANSTAPLLPGATTLESTSGDVTIEHEGMLTTGTSLTVKAAGDFNANGSNSTFIFTSDTNITAQNVKLVNETGSLIYASEEIAINVTGDVLLDGNSESAPLLYCANPFSSAPKIGIKGNTVTITNNGEGMIFSTDGDIDIDATETVSLIGKSASPMISAGYGVGNVCVKAADIEIENKGTGMIFSTPVELTATDGDISVKANTSNPAISSDKLTATAENGDVMLVNNGSGFVGSGKITVDAINITLANPNATSPVSPIPYELTAEENITVVTGYSSTTYNPNADEGVYDFGNKLSVTTSKGTTEHTHEFADVVYNNDATCTADGTKLVTCGCDWAKEKAVVVEGTQLEHIDEDGDYLCDYGCGHEFEKPTTCSDCGRPIHGDTFAEKLFCLIVMLLNLIKTAF